MTARVRDAYRATNGVWRIIVARDQDTDIDRTTPPVTDLPDDIRTALRVWLEDTP